MAKAAAKVGNVNDVLRYTMRSESAGEYAGTYSSTRAALEAEGFSHVKDFNAWARVGTDSEMAYRGINSTFRSREGQLFEVQFHTPESHAMQMATHGLYEQARLITTPRLQRDALEIQMLQLWQQVPVPPGAGGLR